MSLDDFKLIFNTLDYDNNGDIDFLKFCLINTDKHKDIYRAIEKLKLKKQQIQERNSSNVLDSEAQSMMSAVMQSYKKPPLPKDWGKFIQEQQSRKNQAPFAYNTKRDPSATPKNADL